MGKRQQEINVGPTDVLLGRGGQNNKHTGNEILRAKARLVADSYRAAAKSSKYGMKARIVAQMRELSPSGRFLKRNSDTLLWEEVGEDVAREKVGQVLRDAIAMNDVALGHRPMRHGKSKFKDAVAGMASPQTTSYFPPIPDLPRPILVHPSPPPTKKCSILICSETIYPKPTPLTSFRPVKLPKNSCSGHVTPPSSSTNWLYNGKFTPLPEPPLPPPLKDETQPHPNAITLLAPIAPAHQAIACDLTELPDPLDLANIFESDEWW